MKTSWKTPEESFKFGFDFSAHPVIVAGDTLAASEPTVSSERLQGAGTLTAGTKSKTGQVWEVVYSGGNLNDRHLVKCLATTTAGFSIETFGRLDVKRE